MHCFDCLLESQPGLVVPSPAVAAGVCARCGAGICGRHAHVTKPPISTSSGGSEPAPEARRLTCSTCYEAESASAGQV
nr:DUF2180 family protein [Streptomyces echinatus]